MFKPKGCRDSTETKQKINSASALFVQVCSWMNDVKQAERHKDEDCCGTSERL